MDSHFCRRDLPGEVIEQIKKLHHRDPTKQLRILALLIVWVVSAIAILTTNDLITGVIGTIAIVFVLGGAPVVMHEATHGTLFRSRRANHIAGVLAGIPVLLSATGYRDYHLFHHAHTGDPEDRLRIAGFDPTSPIVTLVILTLGSYIFVLLLPFLGWKRCKRRPRMVGEYAVLAGIVTIGLLTAPHVLTRVWLLPLAISLFLTNIRGLSEHAWTDTDGEFRNARTITSSRFLSYFILNVNYHVEHHLYPGVPWYNLPGLHRLLTPYYVKAGTPVERGYLRFAISSIDRTLHRQKHEQARRPV